MATSWQVSTPPGGRAFPARADQSILGLTVDPSGPRFGSNVYPRRFRPRRPAAGDARSADSAHARARATARAGNRPRDPGAERRGAPGRPRLALPGAPAAGGARLDRGRVGDER